MLDPPTYMRARLCPGLDSAANDGLRVGLHETSGDESVDAARCDSPIRRAEFL